MYVKYWLWNSPETLAKSFAPLVFSLSAPVERFVEALKAACANNSNWLAASADLPTICCSCISPIVFKVNPAALANSLSISYCLTLRATISLSLSNCVYKAFAVGISAPKDAPTAAPIGPNIIPIDAPISAPPAMFPAVPVCGIAEAAIPNPIIPMDAPIPRNLPNLPPPAPPAIAISLAPPVAAVFATICKAVAFSCMS